MSWTAEPNRLISQVRLTPNRCLTSALIMKHLPLCQRLIVVGFVSDGVFQAAVAEFETDLPSKSMNIPSADGRTGGLCLPSRLKSVGSAVNVSARGVPFHLSTVTTMHGFTRRRLSCSGTGGQPAGECRSFSGSAVTQRRDPPVD